MENGAAIHEALRRVLHRTDDAGRPLFTPDQLAHLVPFVLLAGADGVRGVHLSDRVATYLGALGATLGLREDASADAIADAAGAYYARFPVHPGLLAEVRAAIADPSGAPSWDEAARALLELLDEPEAARWLPSREDEDARVPAGPLARSRLAAKGEDGQATKPPRAKKTGARKPPRR